MNFFGEDPRFWLAVIGATIIKVATSPYHSFRRAVLTTFAAIFAAFFFTDPALAWLGLSPSTYRNALAAVLALTGEGFMRLAINLINNPETAIRWWQIWRNGK